MSVSTGRSSNLGSLDTRGDTLALTHIDVCATLRGLYSEVTVTHTYENTGETNIETTYTLLARRYGDPRLAGIPDHAHPRWTFTDSRVFSLSLSVEGELARGQFACVSHPAAVRRNGRAGTPAVPSHPPTQGPLRRAEIQRTTTPSQRVGLKHLAQRRHRPSVCLHFCVNPTHAPRMPWTVTPNGASGGSSNPKPLTLR